MLKKTVLDYRYGHYTLFGLTPDFVFDFFKKRETVSDYFLISANCELDTASAKTLDCVHRWAEVDKFHLEPQISRLKARVQADNRDVLSEPELEN